MELPWRDTKHIGYGSKSASVKPDDTQLFKLADDALHCLSAKRHGLTEGMDRALHLTDMQLDDVTTFCGGCWNNSRIFHQLVQDGIMTCAVCCLSQVLLCLGREISHNLIVGKWIRFWLISHKAYLIDESLELSVNRLVSVGRQIQSYLLQADIKTL